MRRQDSSLTFTPATVTQYSYSDTFFGLMYVYPILQMTESVLE